MHTGNVDLLMLLCSVSLFAVSFTQNALECFTTAACDWKSQRTLKTVTANVISSQTIKRQSHNAHLQQHCCTRSHSSCSNWPPSAAAHARSFSPLLHCAFDNALIKTFPLVRDALAKFFNICNFPLVGDPLLHDSPYRIVDGVTIRTIGRPQTWLDEIRRDFFQQLDRLASSVSWRSILLEDEIFRILSDFWQHWQRIYNVFQ